jgi:hypothetical protein
MNRKIKNHKSMIHAKDLASWYISVSALPLAGSFRVKIHVNSPIDETLNKLNSSSRRFNLNHSSYQN